MYVTAYESLKTFLFCILEEKTKKIKSAQMQLIVRSRWVGQYYIVLQFFNKISITLRALLALM